MLEKSQHREIGGAQPPQWWTDWQTKSILEVDSPLKKFLRYGYHVIYYIIFSISLPPKPLRHCRLTPPSLFLLFFLLFLLTFLLFILLPTFLILILLLALLPHLHLPSSYYYLILLLFLLFLLLLLLLHFLLLILTFNLFYVCPFNINCPSP